MNKAKSYVISKRCESWGKGVGLFFLKVHPLNISMSLISMSLTLSLAAYHCRQWKYWRIFASAVAKGLNYMESFFCILRILIFFAKSWRPTGPLNEHSFLLLRSFLFFFGLRIILVKTTFLFGHVYCRCPVFLQVSCFFAGVLFFCRCQACLEKLISIFWSKLLCKIQID